MTELITITEQNGQRAVSARELHQFLESKQQFANWIQNRIKDYGFVEGQDFEVFNNFIKNPDGGRPTLQDEIFAIGQSIMNPEPQETEADDTSM